MLALRDRRPPPGHRCYRRRCRRHCCYRRHRGAMSTADAMVAAVLAVASLALVLRKRAQLSAPEQCTPCEADDSPEVLTVPRRGPRHNLKANDGRPEVASDPRQDPRHHLNRRFFADTDRAGAAGVGHRFSAA